MSFEITTDRLILKVLDSTYASKVLLFYENNQTLFETFEPTRPQNFYTLDFQTSFMDYEYRDIIKGKTLRYYVFPKSDPDTLIGSVNFSNILHGPFSKASIGYKLDQYYHGLGYATEACQAAIEVIFSTYRIHRIDARIAPENIPSIKLIERLGFLYEGIEYKGVEVNGIFRDHYRYSLLAY
ncbi:MAG: GNAT family N-acetyltransferase [Lachnospiraceae bacterium]|nr:GNAT family N-acetyltransferase [Lachnospiraceae bacterium]